ncbi:Coat F domain protein [compost metagenome]
MNPMNSGNESLNQDDLLKIILADLRRTVREYTTATTESSCSSVRKMFTDLTTGTLNLQGKLYDVMSQNQIYGTPAKASRHEVDQKVQEAVQTHQKIQAYVKQHAAHSNYVPPTMSNQSGVQNQSYT